MESKREINETLFPVTVDDPKTGQSVCVSMTMETFRKCKNDKRYLRNIVKMLGTGKSDAGYQTQYGVGTQYSSTGVLDTVDDVENATIQTQQYYGDTRLDTDTTDAIENVENATIQTQQYYGDPRLDTDTTDAIENVENATFQAQYGEPMLDTNTTDAMDNVDSVYRWRDSSVLLLLTLYEEIEPKFNDPKTSKKKVWQQIASNMGQPITGPQCMTKFRTLQKYYKTVKDHNSKSGNDRKNWKYYDRMDEIFGRRAWANPVAIVSSDTQANQPTTTAACTSAEKTRKRSAVEEKIDEYAKLIKKKMIQKEVHERNKDRRHNELMEILKNILNKS